MSRRVYPTEPERIHISGMAGSNVVRFLATIKHGKATRDVAVDVPPEVILRLADCIRATADRACDGKHHRHCPVDDKYVCAHAVWHYDHPEDPMPCIDHDSVIDMGALPTGPQICNECQGPIDKHDECRCEECETCLGVGRIRDGLTNELRKCFDCNGAGMHVTGPGAL